MEHQTALLFEVSFLEFDTVCRYGPNQLGRLLYWGLKKIENLVVEAFTFLCVFDLLY